VTHQCKPHFLSCVSLCLRGTLSPEIYRKITLHHGKAWLLKESPWVGGIHYIWHIRSDQHLAYLHETLQDITKLSALTPNCVGVGDGAWERFLAKFNKSHCISFVSYVQHLLVKKTAIATVEINVFTVISEDAAE
jgi:hypothetical protein